MTHPFSLIVTDTSPLLTLVLADALDVLLRPGIAVSVPDAVYIEATRVRGAPGAERIVEWINAHLNDVRIVPTDIGIDQQRRLEEGRSVRGLGEQAALEVLDRYFRIDAQSEALLLFEDSDVGKRRAIVDERVSLLTTGDFFARTRIRGPDTIRRSYTGFSGGRALQRRAAARAGRRHVRTSPTAAAIEATGGSVAEPSPPARCRRPSSTVST